VARTAPPTSATRCWRRCRSRFRLTVVAVIPGWSKGPDPESISPSNSWRYGFRVRANARPGMTKVSNQLPLRHAPSLSRRDLRPSCFKTFVPLTEEGAGNAGRLARPQPRTQKKKAYERSHRRFAENDPASPAQWCYGFLRARPGDRAFLSPSSAQCASIVADLISASGYQAHTTSPSASVPFVTGTSASIASRAHVRDDRETPLLVARDARRGAIDLPDVTTESTCDGLARRANHLASLR
jgi:hypothetical protein